jgi:hypothetical protein
VDGLEQAQLRAGVACLNEYVFAGNGGKFTLEHGLGVIPDIVAVDGAGLSVDSKDGLSTAIGISSALDALTGMYMNQWGSKYSTTASNHSVGYSVPIDKAATTYTPINSANADTVIIGGDSLPTVSGRNYKWFAIGSLT